MAEPMESKLGGGLRPPFRTSPLGLRGRSPRSKEAR